MQKIVPHLWFDTQAQAAAKLYTTAFKNSSIVKTVTLHDTPSGDADVITINLDGQDFMLLNAGPTFKVNPSVSFMVACKTKEEVDTLWATLSKDGKTMMELGEYPFSKWYGWTEDEFGVSWQIMLSDQEGGRKITPVMMFVGDNVGKAEEAVNFYVSVFKNSKVNFVSHYGEGMEPDKPEYANQIGFTLEGLDFAAMDSAQMHNFNFTEAISFLVNCDTQEEIDDLWGKLSVVPEAEQCGWLKDKYGFSWQISPAIMNNIMSNDEPEKLARVTESFLKMKKINLAELEAAAKGE